MPFGEKPITQQRLGVPYPGPQVPTLSLKLECRIAGANVASMRARAACSADPPEARTQAAACRPRAKSRSIRPPAMMTPHRLYIGLQIGYILLKEAYSYNNLTATEQ